MSRKDVGMPILIRRTASEVDIDDDKFPFKDEVPLYGEPVYIYGGASAKNRYLVIGDGSTTIPNLRRFKSLLKDEADTQVFYDSFEQSEHGWATVKLVDENGTELIPDTHANNVFWKTVTESGASVDKTVKDGLDTLTTWKDNLKYAASDTIGGSATSAKKLTNTTAIGSANLPVYFNASGVPVACNSTLGTTSSVVNITGNAATATNSTNAMVQQANNTTLYLTGVTATSETNTARALKQNSNIYIDGTNNVLMGAAWNDFAEYRKSDAKAGQVVCEVGDGSLAIATKRLQAAPAVISDTYGMAIGITDIGYKPIAVAGRVLVYHEENETFMPGDAVCAAPGGVVSVMTREEIKEYPDRILGYVSEIPTYKTWNKETPVKVDNRIWIKVK